MNHLVIEDKKNCCGCSACYNICPNDAILMKEDEQGFLYPEVDSEKCVDCGICVKICPLQQENQAKTPPKIYAVKAKDDEVRFNSSSGGAFTVLSDIVLEDKGIVYGAVFDENLKVHHIRCDDTQKRNLCRYSKYSQSDMGKIFSEVKKDLLDGRQVLFTGTPCQVDGLNCFLSGVNTEKLFLVDIICHGVLSPKLFSEFLKLIEKKRKKKVVGYCYRAKDFGWSDLEKVTFDDGSQEVGTEFLQTWKKIFYENCDLRPSCYTCKYSTTPRSSDITIGDFWGIEKFSPDFVDTKGVSMVLVNTDKGKSFFEKAKGHFDIKEQTLEEAKVRNPNLYKSSAPFVSPEAFWNDYNKYGFYYVVKKYGRYDLKNRTKYLIKRILKKLRIMPS